MPTIQLNTKTFSSVWYVAGTGERKGGKGLQLGSELRRIRGRNRVHGGEETCNKYDAAHKPLWKETRKNTKGLESLKWVGALRKVDYSGPGLQKVGN
jgi:hypothetical protein